MRKPVVVAGSASHGAAGTCGDSSRTIADSIDGTVSARLITPAGQRMWKSYRQLPAAEE